MGFDDMRDGGEINEVVSFSHRFFEDLEEIQSTEFDNYVLDVNIPYSVAAGRKYRSDVFADSDTASDAWERLNHERFERNSRSGADVLEFSSTPSSRVESVQDLGDSELYLSDITRDCLESAKNSLVNSYEVLEAFEKNTNYLGIKEIMGIENYSFEGLEVTGNRDEDKALLEAAENLKGITCILTYDSDFLSEDVCATIPEIAANLKSKFEQHNID